MEKVSVYYFRKFNLVLSKYDYSKDMATMELINKNNFEPLLETIKNIDKSELNGNGLYCPKVQNS